MKTFIKLLFFSSIVIFFFSCKEKDDRDYIIEFLKKAKAGDVKVLENYFSYDIESKGKFNKEMNYLINVMKYAPLPKKETIKLTIDDQEYLTYEFNLESVNVNYMIGIYKKGEVRQIILISHIKMSLP